MYSKIESIELHNFMVYKHAKISFDESNIICLKGYNSAGKSTILRALAVCFTDAYKRKQTGFIRFGEDYFRIIVNFSDGISVVRDKYINGQSLYEMYKDGEIVYSTKEGNKLTKVSEVPKVIRDYLGLITLENGCLNYQTRSDLLWLIETSGSENYYSLHEILKAESIARANTLLNSDKNEVGKEVAEIESSLQGVELSLQECGDATEELLANLMERENYAKSLLDRKRKVEKIIDVITEIEKLKPIPSIDKLEENRISSIIKVNSVIDKLESMKTIPDVEKMNSDRIEMISKLQYTLNKINSLNRMQGKDIEVIDLEKSTKIMKLLKGLSELYDSAKELKSVKDEYQKTSVKLEGIVNNAKLHGKSFIKCDSCGSYMEVNS